MATVNEDDILLIEKATYVDIADAIREKTGYTGRYNALQMAPAIRSITGGSVDPDVPVPPIEPDDPSDDPSNTCKYCTVSIIKPLKVGTVLDIEPTLTVSKILRVGSIISEIEMEANS